MRTLPLHGYAEKPPRAIKPLLGPGAHLVSTFWTKTAIKTYKKDTWVEARRIDDVWRLKQCLLLVKDLEVFLAKYKKY